MKYFGKKNVEIIEKEIRHLEYIRCDSCNKKIKDKEKYFNICFCYYGGYWHVKQTHKECLIDVINKYIDQEANISLVTFNIKEDDQSYDPADHELVENDMIGD